MGINDDVLNDPSLVPKDGDPTLTQSSALHVTLTQDTDTVAKKDMTEQQKNMLQNADVSVKLIHDGVRDLSDLRDLRNQITAEKAIDKKTVAVAIESFGQQLIGEIPLNSFTVSKTKANTGYILSKINDRISLEQESLSKQCDSLFYGTLQAALHLLSSDKLKTYIDEAKAVCKTVHEESRLITEDAASLSMPLKTSAGENVNISTTAISAFRSEDYRSVAGGLDLTFLHDLCVGLSRNYEKKEMQAFLCVALGHKPYHKNYLTDPTYVYGNCLTFRDMFGICINKDTQNKIDVIGEELSGIRSILENLLGMYESMKTQEQSAFEDFVVDASSTITDRIAAMTSNINLLVHVPFFFAYCRKIITEVTS